MAQQDCIASDCKRTGCLDVFNVWLKCSRLAGTGIALFNMVMRLAVKISQRVRLFPVVWFESRYFRQDMSAVRGCSVLFIFSLLSVTMQRFDDEYRWPCLRHGIIKQFFLAVMDKIPCAMRGCRAQYAMNTFPILKNCGPRCLMPG
jgi:hypothetical protein